MLHNEDVDDDYFTPVAKTSLSNIFRKPESGDKSENESLKYTPPVPKLVQNVEEPPKKPFETVFSCVFDAFLWLDNVYTSKGKLGCAIVKHHNTERANSFHTILLYDSKKATISSAIASKDLEVTVKGNVLSYYDQYEKYWCLNGSDNDIKNILDVLTKCSVKVKVSTTNISGSNDIPQESIAELQPQLDKQKKNTESDTDSSLNRKTKASILNRMANMGQSVLPTRTANEKSSDSSDTNEFDHQIVAVRHKPAKNIAKKPVQVKNISDSNTNSDVLKKFIPLPVQDVRTVAAFDSQIIPLQNTISIPSSSNQDLNYFFTEQRIANSELRINMTRVTDKVDDILNKVNHFGKSRNEGGSSINTEIYQKLLKEYESKIKTYEEIFKNMNKDNSLAPAQAVRVVDNVTNDAEKIELNNKIDELTYCIKQKDDEISALSKEINKLKEENALTEHELLNKITEYKEETEKHKELLQNISLQNEKLFKNQDDKVEQKIKNIMNTTFRAIEVNFEGDESYSGREIKNIIAAVVKKVTIEALNKNS